MLWEIDLPLPATISYKNNFLFIQPTKGIFSGVLLSLLYRKSLSSLLGSQRFTHLLSFSIFCGAAWLARHFWSLVAVHRALGYRDISNSSSFVSMPFKLKYTILKKKNQSYKVRARSPSISQTVTCILTILFLRKAMSDRRSFYNWTHRTTFHKTTARWKRQGSRPTVKTIILGTFSLIQSHLSACLPNLTYTERYLDFF